MSKHTLRLSGQRRMAEAVLEYALTGVPDKTIAYGRPGSYRPERIEVTFRAGDNDLGKDMTMAFYSVRVHGKRIKQDGTPGLVEVREYYRPGESLDRAPVWVHEAVADAERVMSRGTAR